MASARLLHGRESRVQSCEMKRLDVSGEHEVMGQQRKKVDHGQKGGKQNEKKEKRKKE